MMLNWLKLSRRAHVYKTIFDTPEGRIVLADLKQFSHIDRPIAYRSVITGLSDPYENARAEGKRTVVLRIMNMVGLSYEEIMQLRENEENQEENV